MCEKCLLKIFCKILPMSRGPLKGMRAVLFTEVLGLSANYFMPFHGDTARATLWSLHKSEALTNGNAKSIVLRSPNFKIEVDG